MRESPLQHNPLGAKIEEQAIHIALLSESNAILAARWEKIPDRHRPHYTPQQRYRILRLKKLLALSQEEAARRFQVSVATIARWEQEVAADLGRETVGTLVKPAPPVRRFADVVRHLVHAMALLGFGGNDSIARTLARAGWKISSRTVGRIRKEKKPPKPLPEPAASHRVSARYPNHIWMADLTEIPGLFRLFSFHLTVLFDVFSRMPLAARLFLTQPQGKAIAQLFSRATAKYGAPCHFVSDQGSHFTSSALQKTLTHLSTVALNTTRLQR